MRNSAYKAEMARQYGAADKFVQRGLDAYRNMQSFYNPTPNQCIHRLLAHLERVTALGNRVLTEEQRERARDTLFTLIERTQEYDSQYDGSDSSEEIPAGDAEYISNTQGWEETGLSSRRRFHDSNRDPSLRHCRPDMHDERVSFADPVKILSRYVIRADKGLKTYLTAAQDEQFELHHQQWIMDGLRLLERRQAQLRPSVVVFLTRPDPEADDGPTRAAQTVRVA